MDKDREVELTLEDVPIIKDFVNIFPKDLLGLPPEREISFEIELLPGATPISKSALPYGTS